MQTTRPPFADVYVTPARVVVQGKSRSVFGRKELKRRAPPDARQRSRRWLLKAPMERKAEGTGRLSPWWRNAQALGKEGAESRLAWRTWEPEQRCHDHHFSIEAERDRRLGPAIGRQLLSQPRSRGSIGTLRRQQGRTAAELRSCSLAQRPGEASLCWAVFTCRWLARSFLHRRARLRF